MNKKTIKTRKQRSRAWQPPQQKTKIVCANPPKLKEFIEILQDFDQDPLIENKAEILYQLFLFQYTLLIEITEDLKEKGIIPRIEDQRELFFTAFNAMLDTYRNNSLKTDLIQHQQTLKS